ncbi:MAG: hypothetical protein KGS45_14165 [Planctomycetes bacterium]|jgi:hypothetical protein|nr:hypothetical protein [Planctomycetota bacterium]
MDSAELAALRKLAEREYWDVDQLPAYFDVALCLCLDDAGLIEARHVTMSNVGSSFPREPTPQAWYSPVKVPGTGTTWQRILAGRTRDEFNHPYQVRVSGRGQAELARQRRSESRLGVQGIPGTYTATTREVDSGGRSNASAGTGGLLSTVLTPTAGAPDVAVPKLGGWTKGELVSHSGTSDSTFDRIRKAAGVKPSRAGGVGQQRRFMAAELERLIAAAERGVFRGGAKFALMWRELLPKESATNHH